MSFEECRLKHLKESVRNENEYEWWSPMSIRRFAEAALNHPELSKIKNEVDIDRLCDREVNRHDVWKFVDPANKNTLAKVLFILGWGGMRLPNATSALMTYETHWKPIVEEMLQGKEDAAVTAYERFRSKVLDNDLSGMGPAYFTKLIYFLEPSHRGYIMDQWTARSMNWLRNDVDREIYLIPRYDRSDHYMNFRVDSERNNGWIYSKFCEDMESLAKSLNLSPDKTERLIFSRGGIQRVPLGGWRKLILEKTSDSPYPGRIRIKKENK